MRGHQQFASLGCTRTSNDRLWNPPMTHTKLFKNGNSQAVRIPAELAYGSWDIDLVIERHGDELRIRPAQRRIGDVLTTFGRFSDDFMSQGRGTNTQTKREPL